MNIFPIKKIFLLVILSTALISLALFNKNFKQDPLTRQSYFLIAESQVLLSSVQAHISSQIKKYLFLLNLRKENRLLKEENQNLHIQQQILQETLRENERLRQIIDFSKKQNMKLLAAQVISYDFLSKKHILIINKGSIHGIKKFMGVLHPDGILGFIFRVSPHSSQVITLKHPLASLPVRNQRNRQLGLLLSSLGQMKLYFWSQELDFENFNEDFKQGDTLVTIKSNQFPAGLLVGTVGPFIFSEDQLEKQKNPEIPIQPFVKFESLEELFILLEPFESPFPRQKDPKDAS